MRFAATAVVVASALLVASCGGPADTTPPSIVSITPANGATGVAKDANIVIVFSEKMNQATTQAAYQSADLPAAGVTFSWNAAGTQLTINPNSDLSYTAAGKTYAFTLTTTATDLAGNALPATSSSFKTFKQLTTTVASAAALDGNLLSSGIVNTGSANIVVGDSGAVDNATYRGFLSFDLSGLPATLTSDRVVTATLTVHQNLVSGTPYDDLDVDSQDLILDHVNYGTTLTIADFDPTVYANLGDISSDATLGAKSKSVLTAVRNDLTGNRTRSQFRLRFALPTDGDGLLDAVSLLSGDSASNKPTLQITYLTP